MSSRDLGCFSKPMFLLSWVEVVAQLRVAESSFEMGLHGFVGSIPNVDG